MVTQQKWGTGTVQLAFELQPEGTRWCGVSPDVVIERALPWRCVSSARTRRLLALISSCSTVPLSIVSAPLASTGSVPIVSRRTLRSVTLSKRYTPCHASPGESEIVSLPFGVSVTVVWLIVPMRQIPVTVPPLVIWTQLPAKYAGIADGLPVTSVLPPVPLCAVPLPNDGSDVGWAKVLPLSTVRSP